MYSGYSTDRRVMTLKIEDRVTVRCVYIGCTQSLVWDLYHIQGLVRVLSYTCARHTRRDGSSSRCAMIQWVAIFGRARDNPVRFGS